MTRRPPSAAAGRWFVVGHFRGPNVGDEAMLGGILRLAETARRPLAVSTKDGLLPPLDLGDAVPTQRGLRADLAAATACRGIVWGGGTHLHDAYRGTRLLYHYASLLRYLLLMATVRARGRPVVVLGAGVGPVSRAATRSLVRATAALASSVVVRDEASAAVWERTVGRPAVRGADLALLMLPAQPSASPAAAEGPVIVGVVPTQGLGAAPLAHVERCARALAAVHRRHPLRIKLIQFSGAGKENDSAAVDAFLDAFVKAGGPATDVTVVATPADPVRTFSEMQGCHALVGFRFHAVVLAAASGRRFALVPYHPKVSDFAAEIGAEAMTLPLDGHTEGWAALLSRLVSGDGWPTPEHELDELVRRAARNGEAWDAADGGG